MVRLVAFMSRFQCLSASRITTAARSIRRICIISGEKMLSASGSIVVVVGDIGPDRCRLITRMNDVSVVDRSASTSCVYVNGAR